MLRLLALLLVLTSVAVASGAEERAAAGARADAAAGDEEVFVIEDGDAQKVAKLDAGKVDGEASAGAEGEADAKRVSAAEDDRASIEPAAGPSRGVKAGSSDELSSADVQAYRKLMREARAGKAPQFSGVKNDVLKGYVRAAYLMAPGHTANFGELNGWLKDYRDLSVAGDVYKLADARRERPHEVCTTKKVAEKVKVKAKAKGKGHHGKEKTVTKTVMKNVKSCKMVGKLGPAPIRPLAAEMRERKAAEREAAQNARLAKLSSDGRRILGASWRARVRGDYPAALEVLLSRGAKAEAGATNWQGELVKVADFYHGKRDWKNVLKAAEPATEVKGPARDEALWLAGFASYRLGQVRAAADYWQQLVEEEPENGPHFARAAWWASRASSELGQNSKVKNLLKAGARDKVSFYGQLCAAKLGDDAALSWHVASPAKDDLAELKKYAGVRRAIALAQIGEVESAQEEFELVKDDLPYQATRTVALLALDMGLPHTALRAGKDLLERGDVLAPALFPLPEDWAPRGGDWNFDRALMLGIMRQESAFQPGIGSWAGAQGLMQLMPATASYVARMMGRPTPSRSDLHDPTTNLTLAQTYLKYLSGKLDGNLLLVVAAYNGGIGNVQRWLERGVTPGGDPVLWLESIPYDETRLYVEKVFANYWVYQQRLGKKNWSLQALADGYWPLQWKAASLQALSGSGG